MIVRDFKKDDKELYKDMAYEFYKSDATIEHEVDDEILDETFENIIKQSPYIKGVMITVNDEVCGYALLAFYWCNESEGIIVILDELFISKKFRGRHIGTQFLKWLEKTYTIDKYSYQLEVNPRNEKAKKFYEKIGYRISPYIQMYKE